MRFYMNVWTRYQKYAEDYIGSYEIENGFTFNTQLHGGFAGATASLNLPGNQAQYIYGLLLGSHVEIRDLYYNLVYEGFIQEVTRSGPVLTVNMLGYYAHADRLIDDRIYTTNPTTVQEIVEDAADLIDSWNAPIPFLSTGADYDLMVTDPETGAYLAIDFTDIKIKDGIEQSLAYGYSSASPVPAYIVIYDDRTPFIITSEAFSLYKYKGYDIFIHNLTDDPGTSTSLDEVKNKIYAVYANEGEGPSKTTAASDTFSISKYGTMEGVVQNGGNQEGLDLAEDLRDYALQIHAWPRDAISFGVTGFVQHFSGATYSPCNIRAGDSVRFPDLDLLYTIDREQIAGASYSKYVTFVTSTSYDASTNTNTISVGLTDKRLELIMSRLGLSGGLK